MFEIHRSKDFAALVEDELIVNQEEAAQMSWGMGRARSSI